MKGTITKNENDTRRDINQRRYAPPVHLNAIRTAALRCVNASTFLLVSQEVILLTTTINISGINHTAFILAAPGSIHPLSRTHASPLPPCRLDFDRMGLDALPPLTHWTTMTGFIPLSQDSKCLRFTLAR